MIATNLKIIIGTEFPEKDLKALMKRLSAKAQKDIETVTGAAFPVVKEPYLHFENKFAIPFPELKELFRSEDQEIVFRAIGDETIQVPGFAHKLIKIMHDPEAKEQMAEFMCQTQERKEEVEEEKKSHAKKCSDEIATLEKRMDELVSRYRRGYDEREVKCVVQFDFENKCKNFLNEETGEVVASEELQPSDYQLQMNFDGIAIREITGAEPAENNPENETEVPFPLPEPEDELPM